MKIHYYSEEQYDLPNDSGLFFADWEIEEYLLRQYDVIHTYNYLVVIVAKVLHLEGKIKLDSVIIDGVEHTFNNNVLTDEPDCLWDTMLERNLNVRYPGLI